MEMKEAILDAAARQMRRGGYDELSFKGIAHELGITRANIHHHFQSKENLANEACNQYTKEMKQRAMSVAASHRGDFPAAFAALEVMLWKNFEATDGEGLCICTPMLVPSDRIPESVKKTSATYFATMREFLEQAIRDSQDNGTVTKSQSAESIALQAMTMLVGLMQLGRGLRATDWAKHPFRGTMRRWAEGLRP